MCMVLFIAEGQRRRLHEVFTGLTKAADGECYGQLIALSRLVPEPRCHPRREAGDCTPLMEGAVVGGPRYSARHV